MRAKLRAHLFYVQRGLAPPAWLVGVQGANARARGSFRPVVIGFHLTLVRPLSADRRGEPPATTPWHPLTGAGVDVHWLRAERIDHLAMMDEPFVQLVAAELSAAVRQAAPATR